MTTLGQEGAPVRRGSPTPPGPAFAPRKATLPQLERPTQGLPGERPSPEDLRSPDRRGRRPAPNDEQGACSLSTNQRPHREGPRGLECPRSPCPLPGGVAQWFAIIRGSAYRHPHPALSRRERVFVGTPWNDVVSGESTRMHCVVPAGGGTAVLCGDGFEASLGRTGRGRDDETI
jgi:hypothetical protein